MLLFSQKSDSLDISIFIFVGKKKSLEIRGWSFLIPDTGVEYARMGYHFFGKIWMGCQVFWENLEGVSKFSGKFGGDINFW